MIKTFKMKLYPGMEAEYEQRHNQLWHFMADIMETNPDNSPVSKDLKPLFHLD